jgi:hypothetical protein
MSGGKPCRNIPESRPVFGRLDFLNDSGADSFASPAGRRFARAEIDTEAVLVTAIDVSDDDANFAAVVIMGGGARHVLKIGYGCSLEGRLFKDARVVAVLMAGPDAEAAVGSGG